MTGVEFRTIRLALGLTQRQLAAVLGYAHPIRVSEIERRSWPVPVPKRVAAQMTSYLRGYRPSGWPRKRASGARRGKEQASAA